MDDQPEQILKDLVIFYQKLLVPFMKIRRDMPFPTEPERRETDGEHAFTLAMIAISLNERLKLGLDTGKIAEYALVHDLVEVHAGDLSVKADAADHALKEQRENNALMVIKQDFAEIFPWLHKKIETYEQKTDQESQFVYIVDKYAGALGWLAGNGQGWAEYYPQPDGSLYHTVIERLRAKVKKYDSGRLLHLFDLIHEELEQRRPDYYKASHK